MKAEGRIDVQGALAVQVELSQRVGVRAVLAAQRWAGGSVDVRDGQLGVPIRVVDDHRLAVVVWPGLTLPLGGRSSGIGFDLVSTASFDPSLGVSVVYGSQWLVLSQAQVRAPLYAGGDLIRQGVEARVDAHAARRLGWGAVWLGASFVGRGDSNTGTGGFSELAPVAGLLVTPADRWAFHLQARLPVWTDDPPPPYFTAVGLAVTSVVGGRRADEGHGDEDEIDSEE